MRRADTLRVEPGGSDAWREWLAAHGQTATGAWVVLQKSAPDACGLAYVQAVEDALCFGWIDSTTRKLDARRFQVWFVPRTAKSAWSKINKGRVERLISEGRMTVAGMAKVDEARRTGSWTLLDGVETLGIPPDLADELAALPGARDNFDGFSPSSRKLILTWIVRAVRPETRARRVAETAAKAARGIRANHPAS